LSSPRRSGRAALSRLTQALASGGDLSSIVVAITEREAQRSRLEHDLAALDGCDQARGLDLRRVEQDLRAKLDDWRGLLLRNVGSARQALRSLVPARLRFTPKAENGERFYVFEGMAVLDRFLEGIVLPKSKWWPQRDSNPCLSRDHVFAKSLMQLQISSTLQPRRD